MQHVFTRTGKRTPLELYACFGVYEEKAGTWVPRSPGDGGGHWYSRLESDHKPWLTMTTDEIAAAPTIDVDRRTLCDQPRKFRGQKVRFVGRIETSFEYANLVFEDPPTTCSHVSWKLHTGVAPAYWQQFGRDLDELFSKAHRTSEAMRIAGYWDYGGKFGNSGTFPNEMFIVALCPISNGRCAEPPEGRR